MAVLIYTGLSEQDLNLLSCKFSFQGGNLSDICTNMPCKQVIGSCVVRVAATGTSCGNKAWCQMGLCVESDVAPQIGNLLKDKNCTKRKSSIKSGITWFL